MISVEMNLIFSIVSGYGMLQLGIVTVDSSLVLGGRVIVLIIVKC
jgi:hypothetical protein